MKVNSPNKNSNTPFQATIIYNRSHILESLKMDKKLVPNDYLTISKVLDKIDTFATMKEDSIVEIIPRADSGQVNLLGIVYDGTKKIKTIADLRGVRKIVKDNNVRERYVQSIQTLIKNVEQTKKGIDKITQSILDSKNIKGIIFRSQKEPLNSENISKCFEEFNFKTLYMNSLDKGSNPTEGIIKLIKNLDAKSQGSEFHIGLLTKKKKNLVTYFIVESNNKNGIIQKKILLSDLFKISLEDRLI